jgi:hypothetical protein
MTTSNSTQCTAATSGLHDFLKNFETPSAAYRGKPFWCWNGDLEEDELIRQIGVFAEMGMGGFFMHSRTGLRTEYLGDEWFSLINACAEEADRLGMEAWLYDEDRWPSGSAGGLATQELRYRMRYMRMHILDTWKDLSDCSAGELECFAAKVDGLHLECYRSVPFASTTRLEEGEVFLVFTWEYSEPNSFYNGATYLNTLDRDATQKFIEITHEAYKKANGKHFGKTIKGIFTDEPHRGFVMCDQQLQPGVNDSAWASPYTEKLFPEFEAAFGYDLRARLPELFLRLQGHAVSHVKWAYMELIQRMFLDNWAKPLHAWCQEHELELTGHVLHEDSLAGQAVPCGSMMRYYPHMDRPGIDILCNDNENYWAAKQLDSVARQLGQQWRLSELYGASGWGFDFAGHKRIGDWQALLGINLRCHHLSWYTMAGEAKRDYPASIFFQSAWFEEYKDVESYFSRLSSVLMQGRPAADVLVLHPVESLWARINAGWATWLCAKDESILEAETKFVELSQWLWDAQLDFDYGDEGLLAEHGSIEADSDTPLCFGQQHYSTVIVGGMETMRQSTLDTLQAFREAGGTVVFVGESPNYIDAAPSEGAAQLAAQCEATAWDRSAVTAAVAQGSKQSLQVRTSDGALINYDVMSQVREDADGQWIVLLNTNHESGFSDLQIELQSDAHYLAEFDCRTGRQYAVPCNQENGHMTWSSSLAISGERVFRISHEPIDCEAPRASLSVSHTQTLNGPYAYQLNEPNALVLDRPDYQLGTSDWQPAEDILIIDAQLRDSLDIPRRGGTMVQPWISKEHPNTNRASLKLRYHFEIETIPEAIELALEQPQHFQLTINGQPLESNPLPDYWVDPAIRRIQVPANLLKVGSNQIELAVNFGEDVDLEAIYLLGDFGVYYHDPITPTLDTLPDRIEAADLCEQGLPHYTGDITYSLALPNSSSPRKLELGDFGGAALAVKTDGSSETICFPPYKANIPAGVDQAEVTVWLTRRNLFGPMHLIPAEQSAFAPDSFRSTGDEYQDSPVVIASGLLEAPTLRS